MNEVLAISLRSMQGDMARLEQIGMNLANVLTPGYKRGVTIQAPLAASFASHLGGVSSAGAATGAAAALSGTDSATDGRAGTLKSTGRSLDVALASNGYFEVVTDNGPAYTRQGSFRVDARGRLVTAQGYPVMGVGGEITLNLTNPTIDAGGTVFGSASSEAPPLAQLKVVEFEPGAKLDRLGGGLLAAGSGMKQLGDQEVQLRQGFLENSNVSSTHEMTNMIQAMRHFESMQKVVQGYDDMLGTAIRKLGETS